MECKVARKKLKEYASGMIHDEKELLSMDTHIESCMICKRELMLWQDVLAKQMEAQNLASHMDGDFRSRVKNRVNKINLDHTLPPAARRIMSLQKLFGSPKGRMVIQIIALLIGVLFFLLFIKKGTNMFSVFFVALGFSALLFLVLKKK